MDKYQSSMSFKTAPILELINHYRADLAWKNQPGQDPTEKGDKEYQLSYVREFTRSLELLKICEFGEMSRPDGLLDCRQKIHHYPTSRV